MSLSHKTESESSFLPFCRPCISESAIQEVVDCLRSGWITTGPRVQKFEEKLKEYLGAPHAFCLSSATAGLYISLKALNLQPGDEVISTAMTFVATLNTIVLAGAKPVLVDVEPSTYNIDVNKIEKAITSRTKAIIPVHFAGLSVDLGPLYEIAKKHNLRIIEDAAHAIGTEYDGKKIGSFGDTQVFSFHPNKNMTSGEGGCITTRDEAMALSIQPERFHGIDRASWNRFAKAGSQHYDVVMPAHKFNMMDMQAALGIHQLADLDSFIERRTKRVAEYYDVLSDWPELTLPKIPTHYKHRHAWHLLAPLVNPEVAGMSRDELVNALKEHNIGTGVHYLAPHLYAYYKKTYGFKEGDFPIAENIGSRVLSLPLFPDMTDNEFDRVISALAKVFKKKIS